jgi:DNA-binding transcriptional ArsR family regulator
MNITKSLADENRVRIIMALEDKELCVCQLIELLDLAPSTVSKHLSILKNARLVDSRKKGRWIYYRLNNQKGLPATKTALSWVFQSIEDTLQIQTDAKRLEEILKIDPEVLCSRQV